MTYSLLIGQRSYSSWSLRGWLPFAAFDIPVEVTSTVIYSEAFSADVARFGGGETVPVLRTPTGGILTDSLAIAWHLTEAFPDKGLLPSDPIQRAEAQSLIAEMHSGFVALRSACPMNLRTAWEGGAVTDAVRHDLTRLEGLWSDALAQSGGPYLFGAYSLADVFFAPVAIRIAGYGLPVGPLAQSYVTAQLAHPAITLWREAGLAEDAEVAKYDMGLPRRPFPMPV
ncbi:Glutathione S-transferase [Roseibacterium elongatum DSM 19469]|uniref:Glutathione S-transferase n=1 Tax=Roseicyclus elongatus DSM 19469 TaxID=1294273 RepID=W8S278_9RHOB|nr:glutathione S-transferase [Roseibacterium elongatum]AHM02846.1 Glutathione S-transferase [Roseibacterium elongatum DSM 19469]